MDAVSLSYKAADKAECWSRRNASQREVLIRLSLAGRRAVENAWRMSPWNGNMINPFCFKVLGMNENSFFAENTLEYICILIDICRLLEVFIKKPYKI